MVLHSQIVRSEVIETGFGFYTNDAIRNLSVCQVTSSVSQDSLGNYIQGGLYDSKLGCTEMGSSCPTCGQSYVNCPGHCGHIELDVPIYHPMLFNSMLSLLKAKCAYCHKFRLSSVRCRQTLIKLQLLDMGEISNANDLDDLTHHQILDDDKTEEKARINDIESQLSIYEERYRAFSRMSSRPRIIPYHKAMQSKVIEQFLKLSMAAKKCENCNSFSPKYRKDGYSKIFQKPLSNRMSKPMKAMKLELKSGLEALKDDDRQVDDSDHDDTDDEEDDDQEGNKLPDKYLVPIEVEAQIKLLWRQHTELLNFIWSRAVVSSDASLPLQNGWEIFFIRACVVPPNRFRPAAKVGESVAEHPQTVNLSKIIEANEKIRMLQIESISKNRASMGASSLSSASSIHDDDDPRDDMMDSNDNNASNGRGNELSKLVSSWIALQNAVNCYMDSAKDPNILANQSGSSGIRQLLERKEGLFRKNMMGKRVNYCCRSVISPDPYLGVNEIGIPVSFAKVLHYPTPVNDWNVKHLRTLVERGPFEYPGANQIETADGKIIKLEKLSAPERTAKAKLLLSTPGIKVYRHLIDGDVLLVNRQPTLHKPGIMSHKARILKHVKEQTLRMNYANCNAYNADFDGDEINCHFVQNELARAEANFICNTDNQYIVPTSGNPLRGLIQDHVAAAVKLTCKETFLTKQQFQQILYVGVCGLPGTEVVSPSENMVMPPPTIYKPSPLWTGKQVFSSLLAHICRHPLPSLNLDGKTRTPPTAFGVDEMEHVVIIRYGELLSGVMDKAAIGNASLGLVHAVYELYGAEHAGRLLSALGRMLTYHLQDAGHSCGVEDLTLTLKVDAERDRLLGKVSTDASVGLETFLTNDDQSSSSSSTSSSSLSPADIQHRIRSMLATTNAQRIVNKAKLDNAMQITINKSASLVIKACLPNGLERSFLKNNFTLMVSTGAKGSGVNQSQITCFLGQQALEGQRVPMMASGKTLPSFMAYDTSPRAGGFVRDRFLTGVKPQEYYFHCMAGREGLVDTAVKTSRSGYLQRCLMKHLEDLKIAYDMTVRDSGGNIVQFLYGDDGIDPMNSATLHGQNQHMSFLARNNQALVHKFQIHDNYFDRGLDIDAASTYHQQQQNLQSSLHQLSLSTSSSTSSIVEVLKVHSIVYARKRINRSMPWAPKNVVKKWFLAEVINIRDHHSNKSFDIKYLDDQHIEKKVSVYISMKKDTTTAYSDVIYGHSSRSNQHDIRFPLIDIHKPDPIMSSLNLGSNIGCVSEKIQDSIRSYINKNPDQLLTSSTSATTITPDSLELLVWVKYMRSLACPGEAVGCVAAQSIGEPSTQMTLNTFHLAGHGGANVTLGIPRLREVIMTASKSQKTPTMLIPMHMKIPEPMSSAKMLARKLGRLALSSLLHHSCGVKIAEVIERSKLTGIWERCYRIQLQFQSPTIIDRVYDLSFHHILQAVKSMFMAKLVYMIKQEQRRAGDRAGGKHDALNQFKSMGGGDADEMAGGVMKKNPKNRMNDVDNDGHDDSKGGANDDEHDEDEKKVSKKPAKTALDVLLDSDDEDDNGDMDSDEEDGIGKDRGVYDDDDDVADDDVLNKLSATDTDYDTDTHNDASITKHRHDKKSSTTDSNDDDSDDDRVHDDRFRSAALSISKGRTSTATTPAKKSTSSSSLKKKSAVNNDDIMNVDEDRGTIEFTLSFPSQSRRLLMIQMVEKSAAATTVRATKSISNTHAVPHDMTTSDGKTITGAAVLTEGVNFEAIWNLSNDLVQHNMIQSNDIFSILSTYGVEAARQSIVQEINAVFGVYGIDVNPRHLSLIADFMTRTGSYHAMNRIGMQENSSTLLQMSFETTCTFLLKAAQEGRYDNQESPSARIVLGSVPKIGTGCFDIMVPVEK